MISVAAQLVNFISVTNAQTSTGSEYLDPHNAARATVGVPALSWSADLANYALAYAATQAGQCIPLTHSNGEYGENLFWGSAKEPAWTALDAVTAWTDEVAYYDYATNSCTPGQMCGHYTQVVWQSTTHVGCAHVNCTCSSTCDPDADPNYTGDYIICSYDPPGNWIGERPY
jgi:pathogenesis-related protein 1